MIFVDKAIGSNDLEAPLIRAGLPAQAAHLGNADVEFTGRGVGGAPVLIGVEVKRLTELTTDWDRFAGEQCPKMQAPNYDHRWLVYEGEWDTDRSSGLLQRWAGRRRKPLHGVSNATALRKKLLTLQMCGGFHTERTYNRAETVDFLVALYRFWTDDDLDEHKSHLVIYEPLHKWSKPSRLRRMAAILPYIGIEKSQLVEQHFESPREMCNAPVTVWEKIEGIGRKTAELIVAVLNGEE